MTRTRRFAAALAATALVALAACGDDETESSDDMTAPVPVNVAAAGGGDAATANAAAESAGDDPAAGRTDMSIAPWGGYEFEIGDGFPGLPTNATGYRFTGEDVAEDTVRRYAEALGVTGDPLRVDDASIGTLWRVGPEDGTAPSFVVGTDAARSWYYSSAWASAPVAEPCVATDDATAVDCPEPEPPANVPTAEAAEGEVSRLLEAMGQDPATYSFETYADEWFASVLATDELDGLRSPLTWGFGFGAEGVLQYANGYLGTPEQVGPYPLVDLDGALARLDEQHAAWRGGVLMDTPVSDDAATSDPVDPPAAEPASSGTAVAETATTEPAPATTEPATSEPAPATTEPATSEPATTEPLPVDVAPPGEPQVSVLVDVAADLWWVTDVDGATWLLPAYRFTDTEERTFVVPAVTDEYLVIDPVVSGPGGASEPGVVTGSATPAEPEPAPEEPLADVGTVDPATLVGLPVAEATAVLEQDGQTLRVVRRDGEDLPVTMDLVETRVNVAVETRDGVEIVTAIASRG